MNYANILSISDDRRWLVIYIILMGILAFVAFGHLSNHPLDGDDFEYIDDAAAAIQDPSHLFSTDNKLPGRPFGSSAPVSMIGGAFFLLQAGSFRNVQWISCLGYPLALIFALEILRFFNTQFRSHKKVHTLLTMFWMLLGILAHPAG